MLSLFNKMSYLLGISFYEKHRRFIAIYTNQDTREYFELKQLGLATALKRVGKLLFY